MKKIFILTLLSFFGCKNEPICTVNENNAGKEIYDLDEATCFIALKLNKKKSDLNLIRDALLAEMNYMEKIGLTSDNPNPENEPESNTELDINQMVEYALNEEKVNLTKDQLIEIYDTEIEYLIFIGVAGE
ncbi:hypothetical protein FPF71_17805 [Algibacter amylolyticus]|uniref:Uncharacterized protein n=1 Tax=Algibacter amylolyticus TaxID=1608400 RepID=A0A5M7AUM0_9FLAO|nr:hypothetical protein [Algibacter amylolyticus]KAA5820380.1 hypothetical protein F2B50_17805 [Algibacter amylolyticus]MBB5270008.1 hypothetical protein [Algibacter amylolyticus]TSJ70413.1 hypothetical protein FPF71_17805 [Algibacter amylolyticus]